MDAKRQRLGRRDALRLLRESGELVAIRRGNVVRVSLGKDRPSDAELLALVLGPTGKLRAPTLKVGRTLVVGFDRATYAKVLRAR